MSFTCKQKMQAVNLVTEEGYSYKKAGDVIGASKTMVIGWVKLVELHGVKGLERRAYTTYSGQFKVNVIRYMHDNHLSCHAASIHFNLSKTQVQRWERIYFEEGAEALSLERRGRSRKGMPKKKKDFVEHDDLMKELEYLRMENDYLKKLKALVQKRSLQNEQSKSKSSKS